jgi:7-carboxy-7-deazaguanine synthase
MDLKCPDSGECAGNHWTNLDLLKPTDQIKFVIASRRDFDWAAEAVRANRLDRRFTVLFSPVFSLPPNSPAPRLEPVVLARWILDSSLQVRLQLQLHKFIWDPQARGV